MNENDFDLEKWVETIKKHYTTMSGFHPETYKITLADIEATARFFYDLGLKNELNNLSNILRENLDKYDEHIGLRKDEFIELVIQELNKKEGET